MLTFHNLKRIGLLTEQAAGETLTAVESRVSKLVTDRAAGESQSHGELRGRAAHGRELPGWGQSWGWCWLCCPFSARAWCLHSHRAPAGSCCTTSRGSELLLSSFPGKITDAFNSLARKSNFRAISKKLGLVRAGGAAGLLLAGELCPACALAAPELCTPGSVTPRGCCWLPGSPCPCCKGHARHGMGCDVGLALPPHSEHRVPADPPAGRRVRPEGAPGHGLRLQRRLHPPELQAHGAGGPGAGGGGHRAPRGEPGLGPPLPPAACRP